MKCKNPFAALTGFEKALWLSSMGVILVGYAMFPQNPMTLLASLVGATALIFVAKGYVLGQVLVLVFALLYGVISFHLRYYGEVITYLGMSSPIAVFSIISWVRHPYRDTAEVEVHRMTKRQILLMSLLAILVTAAFYFILRALGNARLLVSTFSITTSFVAAYLTMMRSPYYALAYALNDVVLIILWGLALFRDPSYLPMVLCFVVFLANDGYGFWNWRKMQHRQEKIL